jgi:arginyl-tRNA synthetase
MNFENLLQHAAARAIQELYGQSVEPNSVQVNLTPAEYEGHFTLVVFPLVRYSKRKPEETADDLGRALCAQLPELTGFNTVKGFCNLTVADAAWREFLRDLLRQGPSYGRLPAQNGTVVVEYCSPNTNKPLHLGHVRNILLGWSTCQILEQAGYRVVKTQVINDRGVHICKSMLAWQRFGNGATPQRTGQKGDHFVGDYYVRFEQAFQAEYAAWQSTPAATALLAEWLSGKGAEKARKELGNAADDTQLSKYFFKEVFKNTYFNQHSELGAAATRMLEAWEAGDPSVRALWQTMNGWVYEGFDETFRTLGVGFDKVYYESDTYLLGKDMVEKGLGTGVFFRKEDQSVWADLRDAKLDEKLVVRSNGTSVYITQDIGMAPMRYRDFQMEKMVYVVGDEQEYHFKVLFELLKRLGEPYAAGLYHLSYGMVELPEGKMKSREGTVVDADDLVATLLEEVRLESENRDTLAGLSEEDKNNIWHQIALGALKFYLLKVQPKSKMIFDPKKSIDLQGQTGPYIQNAFVRTQAVQRRAAEGQFTVGDADAYTELEATEKALIRQLHEYPAIVRRAAEGYNPGEVANYAYALAQGYHHFWNEVSILRAEPDAAAFRLALSRAVALVLESSMRLLGVEMPEKM